MALTLCDITTTGPHAHKIVHGSLSSRFENLLLYFFPNMDPSGAVCSNQGCMGSLFGFGTGQKNFLGVGQGWAGNKILGRGKITIKLGHFRSGAGQS